MRAALCALAAVAAQAHAAALETATVYSPTFSIRGAPRERRTASRQHARIRAEATRGARPACAVGAGGSIFMRRDVPIDFVPGRVAVVRVDSDWCGQPPACVGITFLGTAPAARG